MNRRDEAMETERNRRNEGSTGAIAPQVMDPSPMDGRRSERARGGRSACRTVPPGSRTSVRSRGGAVGREERRRHPGRPRTCPVDRARRHGRPSGAPGGPVKTAREGREGSEIADRPGESSGDRGIVVRQHEDRVAFEIERRGGGLGGSEGLVGGPAAGGTVAGALSREMEGKRACQRSPGGSGREGVRGIQRDVAFEPVAATRLEVRTAQHHDAEGESRRESPAERSRRERARRKHGVFTRTESPLFDPSASEPPPP